MVHRYEYYVSGLSIALFLDKKRTMDNVQKSCKDYASIE
jgi:hypothetical protein